MSEQLEVGQCYQGQPGSVAKISVIANGYVHYEYFSDGQWMHKTSYTEDTFRAMFPTLYPRCEKCDESLFGKGAFKTVTGSEICRTCHDKGGLK